MTTLDIVIATYLSWSFYQGRRRGLRSEAAGIVGLLILFALLLGFGLFSVVQGGFKAVADQLLQRRGIAITFLVFLATLLAMILFRKHLRELKKRGRPSREPPLYGGVVGLLRAVLLVVVILLGLDLLLPDFLNRAIAGGSMASQVLEKLKELDTTFMNAVGNLPRS